MLPSGAIKTAERKLADRTLVHGGQALMTWAVSNARVEPRGNAIVIEASVRHRKNRSANGCVQRGRLGVGKCGFVAAEYFVI
jgi:hypothetical protein